MSEIPIQHITLQGIRTAHVTVGTGAPVLLLHGWGANIALVWSLAEGIAKAGFCVHALDLPGFGETELPPRTWSVQDYAEFVLAYLDAQNLPRVHLFGHSFGGRIAIYLGAHHPTRLDKIMLCDAAGVKPPLTLKQQLLRYANTLSRRVAPESALGRALENARETYRQRAGSTDYLNAGALKETFLRIINEDLLPIAPQISRPTLLLWGDQDQDTPLWQAQALEKAIPDAGLVVFKGAGHYSYLDALPDTLRVITYFLNQTETPNTTP